LGFEPQVVARKLRSLEASLLDSKPQKFSVLADLPSSLLLPVNLAGPAPRSISMEAARDVPLGATERRHVCFCKWAADGQPCFFNNVP
jgi:hypothetical protein